MDKKVSIPQTVVTCIALSFGIAKSGVDPGQNYLKNV
jgi:hypothetical protein